MKVGTGKQGRGKRRAGDALVKYVKVFLAVLGALGLFAAGGLSMKWCEKEYYELGGDRDDVWMPSREKLKALVLVAPKNYLAAHFSGPARNLDKVYIDIKFKNVMKLREKRDEALRLGILNTEDADLVPAVIRCKDKSVDVKVRLKGDVLDHLQGDKWSLRVDVKGGKSIFGMRRFSIQAPWTRGYHWEAVMFEHFRREGVLAPRYFFVDVVVNGKDIGIMAVEEHFSKELLESQRRREGVILKLNESLIWDTALLQGRGVRTYDMPYLYPHSDIEAFRGAQVAASPELSDNFEVGAGLLRGFLENRLGASEVFDRELLGRYLALAAVWNGYHGLEWRNMRFYFNPFTLKLEPIIYDVRPTRLKLWVDVFTGKWLNGTLDPIAMKMLEDPAVREVFSRELRRLANELKAGKIQRELAALERRDRTIVQEEFPLVDPVDFDLMTRWSRRLAEKLAGEAPAPRPGGRYVKIVTARKVESGGVARLEISNATPFPVEVTGIRWSMEGQGEKLPFVAGRELNLPLELPPAPEGETPVTFSFAYEQPAGAGRDGALEVSARIKGQDEGYVSTAVPYHAARDRGLPPETTLEENLARHPFLEWNEEAGELAVKSGGWSVTGSLDLPEAVGLYVPPGVTLRFGPGGGIVAKGPLRFAGTAGSPIILEGAAGWRGVVALQAGGVSEWKHVTVRGASVVDTPEWHLTGAVTFYESDVRLEDCLFENNNSEDSLNIVRSNFGMTRVEFRNTTSDAFDGDFSSGKIEDSVFADIAGDGVDVSGTRVEVIGVKFRGLGDKGISAGEKSEVLVKGVEINGTGIGIASKDLSRVEVKGAKITGARVAGLAAYIKKPEYGPAGITASGLKIAETKEQALAQTGSEIIIDGKAVPTREVDVDKLYEAAENPR